MKKFTKLLFTFLICFSLSSSGNLIEIDKTFDTQSAYNRIANYNELYGIEEKLSPQVDLNTKSDTLNLKYLAIFIEFQDSDTEVTNHLDDPQSISNAQKLLNSSELFEMDTVVGKINVPSFKKYYEMQSYGKLSIETEIFPRKEGTVVSYKDPHPMGYYLKYSESNPIGYKNSTESQNRETELINGAVAYVASEIESSGIAAKEIDTGNDGIVDAISFFIEGRDVLNANIGWGDLLWSHKMDNYGITTTILGKKVIAYNLLYTYDYTETAGLFSLNRGTYGTIIHEFGHTLGLVDLYRFDNSNSKPVGFYDIMGQSSGSNPQNLLTYFTSEYDTNMDWHDPLPVYTTTTKNITLYKPNFIDSDERRAIKLQIDNSQNEFFIVEYHQKQETYNTYSADSNGIIIYRVNENNKYSGNKEGGDHGELDHIFVYRPNEPHLGAGLGELSKATLNMDRKTFGKPLSTTEFDNETIYYSNGTNSGITIEITSETEDSITFDVTFPSIEGSGTENDPYLLNKPETFLYQMSLNTTGKYYKLMTDLDFKDMKDYPSIDFKGNLEGDGHTLKNISTSTGIFNMLGEYGTPTKVENLLVENVTVSSTTGNHLGGFASTASNATITNVHLLSGSVTNVENSMGNDIASTGGFIGSVSNDTIIDNCSSSLDVTSPKNAGGFIGINTNAKITNSYANGKVTGQTDTGSFIGIQCIMNAHYNIPNNVYYNLAENLQLPPVGGYVESLHNTNALNIDELSIGITGISVPDNILIVKSSTTPFTPNVNPETTVMYEVTSEDANTVSYANGLLYGIEVGETTVYTDIKVGTNKMRLTTKVTIKDENFHLTEEEALNYFGLTKQSNYVTGFVISTDVQTVKNALSSLNDVALLNFKDAAGNEISTGTIATGMTFTLKIDEINYDYIVVIKGDVNGDGLIYATDYVKIKNQIMGRPSLEGEYYLAADIDNDGNIYATDYVKIKNYIMGRGAIPQIFVK